jgi:hypothetical protein
VALRPVKSTIRGRIRITRADGTTQLIMGERESRLRQEDIDHHRTLVDATGDPFLTGKLIFLDGHGPSGPPPPASDGSAALVDPDQIPPDPPGLYTQTELEALLSGPFNDLKVAVESTPHLHLLRHMLAEAERQNSEAKGAKKKPVSEPKIRCITGRIDLLVDTARREKDLRSKVDDIREPAPPMGPRGPLERIE